jgi:hypothetical protein
MKTVRAVVPVKATKGLPVMLAAPLMPALKVKAGEALTGALRTPWGINRTARSSAAAGVAVVALSAASALASAARRRVDSR